MGTRIVSQTREVRGDTELGVPVVTDKPLTQLRTANRE